MPLVINDVQNELADGATLRVYASGTPVGTLRFFCTTNPQNPPGYEAQWVSGGQDIYDVNVSSVDIGGGDNFWGGAPFTRVRHPIYVTAVDDSGASNVACEWICVGTNADVMTQMEWAVRDILRANHAAINKSLQHFMGGSLTWQNGQPITVTKILAGSIEIDTNAAVPAISVACDRIPGIDLYFGLPHTDEYPMAGEVLVYLVYGSKSAVPAEACRALGQACLSILNQFQYLEVMLPCGLSVGEFYCPTQEHHDEWVEDLGCRVAFDTVAFQGKLHLYRHGGI